VSQQKYSAFDWELLAVVLGICHFRWALEGRVFCVLTDHTPLTQEVHRLSDTWTARQQRHLSYMAKYTTDVQHLAGTDNVVADTLSRYTAAAVVPTAGQQVTTDELASAQAACAATQEMKQREDVRVVIINKQELVCMEQTGSLRPRVPVSLRRRVFESIHGLAHPGMRTSRRMLMSHYVWPSYVADVEKWCRA